MIVVKKILRIDGVNFVLKKQNRKLFIYQKFLLTSAEDNTNVQFVAKHLGYKVDAHQLRAFTNFLRLFLFAKNRVIFW
jgi:hypothetical protein